MKALRFLIEKEFKQMFRNIILPVVFVALPLLMLLGLPRAATQEIRNLNVCIVDNDHSSVSSRLIAKISASSYFHLCSMHDAYRHAIGEIDNGDADIIVEIEPGFEKNLVRIGCCSVLISANAVNGVKAGLGSSYLAQIVADFAAEIRDEQELDVNVPISVFDVAPRYLYNSELDYKSYMIPGLISMLMILIMGFLPALNIVGEKEKGTIEQINVTPVGKFEFILSKLIPYWCVGSIILCYAMTLAWAFYGLVPAGNMLTLFLFATLFTLIVSGLGLIVSNYSDTMQQAALVMFFFLVIFILLSGLLTPITSMPEWAKVITYFNPLRYFIEVMRALYLKGSGMEDLLPNFFIMLGFTVVTCIVAVVSYRKRG